MNESKAVSSGTSHVWSPIWIACAVGLAGGLIVGALDGARVLIEHGPRPLELEDVAGTGVYAAALYTTLGTASMLLVGIVVTLASLLSGLRLSNRKLTALFSAAFTLLVLVVFSYFVWPELAAAHDDYDIATVVMGALLICGGGILIAKTPNRGTSEISPRRLLVLLGTLSLTVLAFLYAFLWIKLGELHGRSILSPTSLLAVAGLTGLGTLCFLVCYRLSLVGLRRLGWRKVRRWGAVCGAVVAALALTVTMIGPFRAATQKTWISGPDIKPSLADPGKPQPNILWIVMDTVRADHLSCYGYARQTTPYIDSIASEGALFAHCLSSASWTVPSHASMFTGLLPDGHNTDENHQWLDQGFDTVAEVLHSCGYRTFSYSNNVQVGPMTNLTQGFGTIETTIEGQVQPRLETSDYLAVSRLEKRLERVLPDEGAARTNEVVFNWIEDGQESESPFFMFINYMEAHTPYDPPEGHAEQFLPDGIDLNQARDVPQYYWPYYFDPSRMTESNMAALRGLYDGDLSYLDEKIGELMDYLEQQGILDSTLVIITSDHGEEFGEHKLLNHNFGLYDTLIHVPLIVRYPPLFEAGKSVTEQVQLVDLFPTLLEAAGISYEADIQGHSLLHLDGSESRPALSMQETPASMLGVLHTYPQFDSSPYARELKALSVDGYKFIWASDGRHELYDIVNDPGELTNLVEAQPAKTEEMRARLEYALSS